MLRLLPSLPLSPAARGRPQITRSRATGPLWSGEGHLGSRFSPHSWNLGCAATPDTLQSYRDAPEPVTGSRRPEEGLSVTSEQG